MKLDIKKHTTEIAVAIVYLIAFFPTLNWMWDRWWAADSYYSHGILVPFVCGYLIWQMRAELKKIRPKESRWGMVLIIGGVVLYLFSALLRVNFTGGFAMFLTFIGLILHFYGWEILRKIAFPVAFLFFMFPMPEYVVTNLSFRMKLFAAQIATAALNQMGILAVRKGSIIYMRSAQVVVDDVCSGLRSLISLTALGSIFAFWLKSTAVKRILLFLSTVPIAVLTNVCRVVLLAMVSEIWGPDAAKGFVHDASGFLVFALAFVMLFGVKKIIE